MAIPKCISWLVQTPPQDFDVTDPDRILDWNERNAFGGVVRLFQVSRLEGVPTLPASGWEYLTFYGWIPRYLAYRGSLIEFYFGFRPTGLFGIGLRHSHAKNYK